MAEQLDEYAFTGRNSNKKYPWDQWFDGRIWRLTRGVDFDISVVTMRAAMHVAANRRWLKIRTKTESETVIVVQAVPADSEGGDCD